VVSSARPATLLALVQEAWPQVAGETLAAEADPVAEREGVLTVRCSSAAWAQELELMAPELLERLADRIGPAAQGTVERIRFRTGSEPNWP
jgi:predicted nucleic acid-binding Zn ribbon protein